MSSVIPTVIRVGARPAQLDALGTYFNGESAEAKSVTLHIDECAKALVIKWDGGKVNWLLAQTQLVPDQADQDQLLMANQIYPLARLITDEKLIALRCPNLHRSVVQVNKWRILTWALAAVMAVALIIFVLVPRIADNLADLMPPNGEQALGAATLGHIRGALDKSGTGLSFCTHEAGRNVLNNLTVRLTPGQSLPELLTVHVLNHDMVNAFALPGGQIVVFRGLIEVAETPEELVAVIAHEIGHLVSRDPTRHALRSAGSIGVLGLLFGDFAGGALLLFLAEQLIEARYSQTAETEADSFAHQILIQIHVSPASLGDMFQRFLQKYGEDEGVMSHFVNHPEMIGRIEAARAAVPKNFQPRDLLEVSEWRALKNICS
ncbi:M48 family metallopeptidase [Pseudopelagicola sp. nBUS_20]|uniref:M48 family metallopeptidase n=1 Tax=Pseudopelagicola sp. nBUS_20 TaxID=3395317 RepID=UPI003EC09837